MAFEKKLKENEIVEELMETLGRVVKRGMIEDGVSAINQKVVQSFECQLSLQAKYSRCQSSFFSIPPCSTAYEIL